MKKLNASISELASRMSDLSTTQASLAPNRMPVCSDID
jgi:hypothetical protein